MSPVQTLVNALTHHLSEELPKYSYLRKKDHCREMQMDSADPRDIQEVYSPGRHGHRPTL